MQIRLYRGRCYRKDGYKYGTGKSNYNRAGSRNCRSVYRGKNWQRTVWYQYKYIDNIVRNQKITRVPKTQTYYKGVINLRGEIIPVMSIRLKLGLEDDEFTDKTRIIIVKIEGATIGVIVDQVREVVTLDDDNTEKITRTSRDDAASGYISSIGKSKGELISLLDIVGLIVEN